MGRVMKDSGVEWIGEIPELWEVAQLKRFCTINNGKEIENEVDQTSNIAIDVFGSGGIFKYTDKVLYSGEAVLFGRKGTLGKPIYVNQPFWTVDTMYYLTFRSNLFPKFCYYQLLAFDWKPYITKTALPSIVASQIVGCKFAFPNLMEQIKIINYLGKICDEIDNIIKKTKCSIEEYQKLKKAIVIKAVTKGLNEKVCMKRTDSDWIGEIPAHWNYVRIQRLFDIVDERNEDENALLLSLYTAIGVKPRNELEEKGNKAITVMNYKKVQKNDVIVNKLLAWMGAIGYSDYEGVTSPDYDVYRAKEGANVVRTYYNEYFRHTCFSGDCYKYGHGIMLMRWRTYPEEFLRIKVPNPPREEQEAIAKYLDEKCTEIDRVIEKKEAFIAEMENYKKSLIYEYVTGKKEVENATN